MSRKRGFTLIETLTVSTCSALLISLVVPSLQQARVSSQRERCRNNLKQIGIALHNYHDVYRGFAPGWIRRGPDAQGRITNGWGTAILPFMEQQDLFNRMDSVNFDVTYPNGQPNPRMHEALKTPISFYRCPSEPKQKVNTLRGNWGISNYTGNFGATPIPNWGEGIPGNVSVRRMHKQAGIFWGNSFTRMRDIRDGTSNTLMVGERSLIGRSALWFGVRSNFHQSDTVSDGSWASPINKSETGFSSRHRGGVNVALCDGAVVFLADTIASSPQGSTFQHLAARADFQAIGEF